ncbi:hypothetical protein M3J09_001888 [Ascochyta lentis]
MLIYYAILHFIVRSAFFTFYLQFSNQSNLRFWIGMGFGLNIMLLIIDVLLIVFQCKPIAATFEPLQRLTAQCMDQEFGLYAPAVLVRSEATRKTPLKTDWFYRTPH